MIRMKKCSQAKQQVKKIQDQELIKEAAKCDELTDLWSYFIIITMKRLITMASRRMSTINTTQWSRASDLPSDRVVPADMYNKNNEGLNSEKRSIENIENSWEREWHQTCKRLHLRANISNKIK